jgi:hypothetical protein
VGKIESGEHQLNVLEFCEYVDTLGADATETIKSVEKAGGQGRGSKSNRINRYSDSWPFSDVTPDAISIYDGADVFLEEFAAAAPNSQVAFAAYWLQAEVLNGGLGQFFANDTGMAAPEAVAASRTLGLPLLASKIEEAMRWFGLHYPRGREPRQNALEAYERDHPGQGPFGHLDKVVADLIYEEAGGLEQAAIRYLGSRTS